MPKERFRRMTAQREIILEVLRKGPPHPTADEIYARVRRRLPRISLGTIYRNLDILAEQGVIQKLDMSGSQRRFDVNVDPHHHVRCLECGALDDVSVLALSSLEEILQDTRGYEIHGVQMEFSGLCPKCRRTRGTLDNDGEVE